MPTLVEVTKYGGMEDFLAVYESGQATSWTSGDGRTLLTLALANTDPVARVAIANRLLDDGADASVRVGPERFTTPHLLLGHTSHEADAEAPLLKRLLDGGADVNAEVPGRWGTPLRTLARQAKFSDAELAPFYDVLFARPDLDLLRPDSAGISAWEDARRKRPRRQGLVDRMEDHLRRHGRWTDDLQES
jgi:hypothetical protein